MNKIGDIIKDTEAYGTVRIADAFLSPTSNSYVYLVELVDDPRCQYLVWPAELFVGAN